VLCFGFGEELGVSMWLVVWVYLFVLRMFGLGVVVFLVVWVSW